MVLYKTYIETMLYKAFLPRLTTLSWWRHSKTTLSGEKICQLIKVEMLDNFLSICHFPVLFCRCFDFDSETFVERHLADTFTRRDPRRDLKFWSNEIRSTFILFRKTMSRTKWFMLLLIHNRIPQLLIGIQPV